MELKIDKELQKLTLQDHGFSQLEENILADGCQIFCEVIPDAA